MSPQSSDGEDRPTAQTALTVALALVLLASLGGVVYVALTPAESTNSYTEFYVLGANGTAADYPTNLSVGETGTVTVGITNQENTEIRYTVLALFDEEERTREAATLDAGETWERDISVTPSRPGRNELRLLLFEGDAGTLSDAQKSLRIWIRAAAPDSDSSGSGSSSDRSVPGVGHRIGGDSRCGCDKR